MALRIYQHNETGEIKRSLKTLDSAEWTEVLVPPNTKFMEKSDPVNGKSREKGLQQTLTERSRNHARNVDIDDTIHLNRANGLDAQVKLNLLNEKGERRRKIDDI